MAKTPTGRVKLVAKTVTEARAMIEALSPGDRAHVSSEWLARMHSPAVGHWTLGYTIVRIEDGAAIGQCGFKRPPECGVVEIAYGVAPEFEGRGYATEAARVLTGIAFDSAEVDIVIAHTFAPVNASARVLTKAGFESVGQVIDPEDGAVWRWEKRRETT